jgi:hypothetical protein
VTPEPVDTDMAPLGVAPKVKSARSVWLAPCVHVLVPMEPVAAVRTRSEAAAVKLRVAVEAESLADVSVSLGMPEEMPDIEPHVMPTSVTASVKFTDKALLPLAGRLASSRYQISTMLLSVGL